jgi:hypothetical protein
MNIKFRKFMLALTLILVGLLASLYAFADGNGKPAPLIIHEQSSFAVEGG